MIVGKVQTIVLREVSLICDVPNCSLMEVSLNKNCSWQRLKECAAETCLLNVSKPIKI